MKITPFMIAMFFGSVGTSLLFGIPAAAQNTGTGLMLQQATDKFIACNNTIIDTPDNRFIAGYMPPGNYTPGDLADTDLINDAYVPAISKTHELALACREHFLIDIATIAPEALDIFKPIYTSIDDNYNAFLGKQIGRGAYLSRRKELGQNFSIQLASFQTKIEAQSAKEKGIEYAQQSGTSWELSRTKNEMTDKIDVVAQSSQENDQGAVAKIKVYCVNQNEIVSLALIVDQSGNATIQIPGSLSGSIIATTRVNEESPQDIGITTNTFSNQFLIMTLLSGEKGRELRQQTNVYNWGSVPDGTTWRYMVHITTSLGPILIKIPVYQDQIQQVIKSCA